MRMPELEKLNPHLFEASDHAFTGQEKAQNNFPNHTLFDVTNARFELMGIV